MRSGSAIMSNRSEQRLVRFPIIPGSRNPTPIPLDTKDFRFRLGERGEMKWNGTPTTVKFAERMRISRLVPANSHPEIAIYSTNIQAGVLNDVK